MTAPGTILVSACLLGLATRYDGAVRESLSVRAYLHQNGLTPVPVCPEQLAGLSTPRPRCWFATGDGVTLLDGHGEVVNEDGRRMNAEFVRGANATLRVAGLAGCTSALLKDGSPSCGVTRVTRACSVVPGMGVTAALLQAHGLTLLSDEALPVPVEEIT